jgi:CBS domain-containing protein
MVSVKDLRVKDIMKKTKLVAKKDQLLSEVLGKMKKHGIHEMPVVEKGRLMGFVDLDQLIRSRKVPMTTMVGNILTPNPSISPSDNLPKVAKDMISSDSKAMPVTVKERFQGIVSRTDLIAKIPQIDELKGLQPADVMTPTPTCVSETDTVDHARKVMRELDERTIPVTDKNGLLIGSVDIMSIMDILKMQDLTKRSRARKAVGGKKRPRPLVRDIMSGTVAAIGQKASLKDIIRIMNSMNSSSVVITEKDSPIGIITQWDLLEVLASMSPKEGVHIQITGLEHEDAAVFDAIYWYVQKFLKKVSKRVQPTMLNIHGIEHMKDGITVRYTFSVKLLTTKKPFMVSREGYDIFKVVDQCLFALERMIEKKAGRRKKSRKGK